MVSSQCVEGTQLVSSFEVCQDNWVWHGQDQLLVLNVVTQTKWRLLTAERKSVVPHVQCTLLSVETGCHAELVWCLIQESVDVVSDHSRWSQPTLPSSVYMCCALGLYYFLEVFMLGSCTEIFVSKEEYQRLKKEEWMRRKWRKPGLILRRQRSASLPCLYVIVSRADHSAGSSLLSEILGDFAVDFMFGSTGMLLVFRHKAEGKGNGKAEAKEKRKWEGKFLAETKKIANIPARNWTLVPSANTAYALPLSYRTGNITSQFFDYFVHSASTSWHRHHLMPTD